MSRFYGSMVNSHGNTVTAGNADDAHIRGWSAGVHVSRYTHDTKDEKQDIFVISMTTGSGGYGHSVVIGRVLSTPDGPRFDPANIDIGALFFDPECTILDSPPEERTMGEAFDLS